MLILIFDERNISFEVDTASNGEEAVDMVRNQSYRLILMDIEMPIMNGLEATSEIRTLPNGRDVPIIALTAHSVDEKLKEIKTAGMNDFLLKPLDQEKTSSLVKKYL